MESVDFIRSGLFVPAAPAGAKVRLDPPVFTVYTRPVAKRAAESKTKKRRGWPFSLHGSHPAKEKRYETE